MLITWRLNFFRNNQLSYKRHMMLYVQLSVLEIKENTIVEIKIHDATQKKHGRVNRVE